MSMASLEDLLVHELKDLYSAEKQMTKALPKMAKAAHSKKLKQAFQEHLEATQQHVERLDEIFAELEASSRGPKCVAMEGLIEEGSKIVAEKDADPSVKDAALIAAAQRVEHYEIAGYGTVRTFARLLGHSHIEELLQQTLNEEGETDHLLTELAETEINVEAQAAQG